MRYILTMRPTSLTLTENYRHYLRRQRVTRLIPTRTDKKSFRTYIRRRNAVQSAETMETYSRTGSPFLAEMATGMAAETQHAKELAQGKTQHTDRRDGPLM